MTTTTRRTRASAAQVPDADDDEGSSGASDPCRQTLEALEDFIQTQRTLLARTQSDIERLRALRHDALHDPQDFIDNLASKLDSPSFRLSSQPDLALSVSLPSSKIHWGAFAGHDPTTLRALPAPTPKRPSPTPQTLSKLQTLVKHAKLRIIDPVLLAFPCPSPPPFSPSSSDSPMCLDPEELRRRREHEKIRELKKMKIRGGPACGLSLIGSSAGGGAGRRGGKGGRDAVFVRYDVDDESGEVDISVEDTTGASAAAAAATPPLGEGPDCTRSAKVKREPVDDVDMGVAMDVYNAVFHPPPASPPRSRRAGTKGRKPSASSSHSSTFPVDTTPPQPKPRRKPRPIAPDPRTASSSRTPTPSSSSYSGKAPAHLVSSSGSFGGKSYEAVRVLTADADGDGGVVDMDVDGDEDDEYRGEGGMGGGGGYEMDEDEESEFEGAAAPPASKARSRNTTTKSSSKPKSKSKSKPPKSTSTSTSSPTTPALPKPPKPKPETYKQPWTTAEQHLLEQLLESIPEGEKFRWQKISRAMGGRRTPRQVASRVQKYFEKLKRFGVG